MSGGDMQMPQRNGRELMSMKGTFWCFPHTLISSRWLGAESVRVAKIIWTECIIPAVELRVPECTTSGRNYKVNK